MLTRFTRYPVIFGLGMFGLILGYRNRHTLFLQNIEEERSLLWSRNEDPDGRRIIEAEKARYRKLHS